ncbi:MAG: recombination factor protein RarA, partial [Macromonas bipunctata]|nr:recombination factor protein RarA [Macromonas bipunctata]
LVAIASEDIGNADPRALPLAMAAAQALERQGLPEGELALAQATTYLAVAPKSNAAYLAWQQAKAFVRQDGSRPVPAHLRNAPTALLRHLGHGAAYRYPHDEPDAYAAGERYWPDGVAPPPWYQPVPRGLEIKMADKLARLRALDEVAATSAKLK